ncbi:MAG: hypothetical protein IPN19_00535 [Elusimicrobia bacterium]|nr:hypothetical protein [Elusimicrobiota bacterium]
MPSTTVPLKDGAARQLESLLDELENHDDVKDALHQRRHTGLKVLGIDPGLGTMGLGRLGGSWTGKPTVCGVWRD